MDLWTFHRYREPRLSVDAVELDLAGRSLRLRQGSRSYRLQCDDADAARQLASELESLRDDRSPLWQAVRESPPGGAWAALGEFLDTRSLIREGHDGAAEYLTQRMKRIEDCIAGTLAAATQGLSPARLALVKSHARLLRRATRAALAGTPFGAGGDPLDASIEPNFFLALLTIEFEYFRRASPLTLIAAHAMLERLSGKAHRAGSDGDGDLAEASALYDAHDLEAHLWLVAQCLVAASGENAVRLPAPALPPLHLSTGLEAMRQIELLTRETLERWGPNPYVAALDELRGRYSPLVAGPFIEQYHVTRRFVEIIAPLLSKRLAAPLRGLMFRYYSEEVGHEALESTTCEALGVSRPALDRMLPLPLHFAFVDALTLVAELDPISSFAAIMVIEGVFGEPPRMALRLAAVARTNRALHEIAGDHEDLNISLNHNSIPRDAFEHIAAVTPATQARAMRRILFLLELNHRAWGSIADFYGRQHVLRLQGPLGRPFSPEGDQAG